MEKTIEIPEGYEAALERCKQWVAGISGLNPGASPKEVAEYLFPELAESEDEKIRKWLIEEIKATHDYDSPTSRKCVDDAIAYLERQKEQKPLYWMEDDRLKGQLLWRQGYETGKIAAKQEQKPAEWSKEEMGILLESVTTLQNSSNWLLAEKLKSLRPQPHWKPSEEQMEALKETIEHLRLALPECYTTIAELENLEAKLKSL